MSPYRDMTDEEWQRVAPLIPELRPRSELRGRPLTDTRNVLNGVLWVMCSGARWSAMPRRYPPYQTCHRRFKLWHRTGALQQVLVQLFGDSGNGLLGTLEARMRQRGASEVAKPHGTDSNEAAPITLENEPQVAFVPTFPVNHFPSI
ncbi:transposase [Paraburkholderia acidicola]|uniref:Transposase n=1 Tax=Paraburkholderia acidicola TaxID=1912599 RepID=A0ABV1LFZ6_9BURK